MKTPYSETIKLKREADAARKQREEELKQSNESVVQGSNAVAAEVARQGARSRTTTQRVKVENTDLARDDSLTKAIDSINKMNLTTFMSYQGYEIMVDTLANLNEELKGVQAALEEEGINGSTAVFAQLVGQIDKLAKTLATAKVQVDDKVLKAISGLQKTFDRKDFKPVINVDAPSVVVQEREIDFSPLEKSIKSFIPKTSGLDLSAYRAQDLDEMEIGVQYVGMLNPDGGWYIIKNIEAENSLRYKFGSGNYSRAWSRVSTFDYKHLDEAVNEAKT